ncbi:solute carrier family 22 member 13-like [Haemaphysalis longicornis]
MEMGLFEFCVTSEEQLIASKPPDNRFTLGKPSRRYERDFADSMPAAFNRSRRSMSRSSLNQPQVIMGAAGGDGRRQEASVLVGRHGPFQAIAFHFGLLAAFVFPFYSMPMETFVHDIDHWCARPENLGNMSLELWKSQMIPRGADGEYSRCRMYAEWNSTGIATVPCTRWEYGPSMYGTSIVEQFDIVCERAWFLPISGTIFSVGVICGLLIAGPLADWIGRKPVIQFSVAVLQTASLMILFTRMLSSFMAMRFLQGAAAATLCNTGFVLVVESLAPNYRTLYSMAVLVGYMCGSVVVAFLMVLKIDWKTMQVISMLPGLMMLSLFRKIVESPRWLMARGSLDEAEAVIIYAVTLNGENIIEARQLWARTRREIERARSEVPTEVCCCELFRVQGSCRRSIILFYCWSVMAFAVNATYFDINSLNFHPSLMLVLGAVLAIPAEICAIVFAARLGRCASQAGALACTAVACFVVNLISEVVVTPLVSSTACCTQSRTNTDAREGPGGWAGSLHATNEHCALSHAVGLW